MMMQTNEDELRDFGNHNPNVTPNDRPFNMGGKPIVNAESQGLLDGKVNKTTSHYNGSDGTGSNA